MSHIDTPSSDSYHPAVDRMDHGRLFRKMTLNSRLRIGFAVLVVASGLGVAWAQPVILNESTSNQEPSSSAPADANMSSAQMRAVAATYVPAMEQSGQTIRRQLEQARAARDVVKVLCLNDKLNQVDVAVRSTQDRMESLGAAADRNDVVRTRHEFSVIQVLRERVRALSQEAGQCIGEETGFIDNQPKVNVEIDPAIPLEDPTGTSQDPQFIATPPTIISAIH